jgi:uncharacterized membrane protein YidH (DUF202 family)
MDKANRPPPERIAPPREYVITWRTGVATVASVVVLSALYMTFRRFPLPRDTMLTFLLSLWMSVIFVERLIIDLATVKYTHHSRPVTKATLHPAVLLCFTISVVLLSVTMVLNQSSISFLISLFQRLVEILVHSLRDFYSLALFIVAALFLAIFKYLRASSLSTIFTEWLNEVSGTVREYLVLLLAAGGAFALNLLFHWLAERFPGDPNIRDIVTSWTASNVFVIANTFMPFIASCFRLSCRIP